MDLTKSQREEKGLLGGVVRLVYINALAMPEGFQPTAGAAQYPEWMRVDKEKGVVNVSPADAKAIFYNDLSQEKADKWIAKIQPQSEGVYHSKESERSVVFVLADLSLPLGGTTTYAAWRDIPSTFVSGLQDKSSITLEVVNFMISSAQQQVPSAFDVVERSETGSHCLMLSQPEWLAGVMRRAAGENI